MINQQWFDNCCRQLDKVRLFLVWWPSTYYIFTIPWVCIEIILDKRTPHSWLQDWTSAVTKLYIYVSCVICSFIRNVLRYHLDSMFFLSNSCNMSAWNWWVLNSVSHNIYSWFVKLWLFVFLQKWNDFNLRIPKSLHPLWCVEWISFILSHTLLSISLSIHAINLC